MAHHFDSGFEKTVKKSDGDCVVVFENVNEMDGTLRWFFIIELYSSFLFFLLCNKNVPRVGENIKNFY